MAEVKKWCIFARGVKVKGIKEGLCVPSLSHVIME
jgi:hypothetical protein